MDHKVSSGHEGLDQVIDHLRLGDNVVFQVDDLQHYRTLTKAFCQQALQDGRTFVYFRFAQHDPVLTDEQFPTVKRYAVDAQNGFESFTTQIYSIIEKEGEKVFYAFDCLTELLSEWASDLMIGNFFYIICPFLFKLDTVAYFALKRGEHAYGTVARIRQTTQLLLDWYQIDGKNYLHPLKVWKRYSPTMFLPHLIEDQKHLVIDSSAEAAMLFSETYPSHNLATRQIDYWDRLFARAATSDQPNTFYDQLSTLLIGEEGRIPSLAKKYFNVQDLLGIQNRQIGTGKIGGKAVGMLLARKIVDQSVPRLSQTGYEPHDSFYLGSDLFYTYIVQNGWWALRMQQKSDDGYYKLAARLQGNLRQGTFPPFIREMFQQMLEYYGQSPIIVRSSSLLEDDYGNAFAGKYESVFCANQGSPEDRLQDFEQAVRVVYASLMDVSALAYRRQRGLAEKDEQMAILVQRVSGSHHGPFFYPLLAGVGHSQNLYAWHERQDPAAGMLRLVHGLGTRAVDRIEKDRARLIALDHPEQDAEELKESQLGSQRYLDVIDLVGNDLRTIDVTLAAREGAKALMRVADVDWQETRKLQELRLKNRTIYDINFRNIIQKTRFIEQIRMILKALEDAYENPVDIEFTVNEDREDRLVFCLLQCRPLQIGKQHESFEFPETISIDNIILRSDSRFMGGNRHITINYMVYVIPEMYVELTLQEKYQVARTIGKINRFLAQNKDARIMLLGPGRWGTTTPSLGVPVNFSEISHILVLGEMAFSHRDMKPELSYGSHFFQDLVETDIFYLAVDTMREGSFVHNSWYDMQENSLARLLPEDSKLKDVIQVFCLAHKPLHLYSSLQKELVILLTGAEKRP